MNKSEIYSLFFLNLIRPSRGLLPVLGSLERYMTPTLDTALLISSRAGTDLGLTSDKVDMYKSVLYNLSSCSFILCMRRKGGH